MSNSEHFVISFFNNHAFVFGKLSLQQFFVLFNNFSLCVCVFYITCVLKQVFIVFSPLIRNLVLSKVDSLSFVLLIFVIVSFVALKIYPGTSQEACSESDLAFI